MATKMMSKLKETINKNQRTAAFFWQHFPTHAMVKNSTGFIDSRIGVGGKASDVIKDCIEKIGEHLMKQTNISDTLCCVLIPVIEKYTDKNETAIKNGSTLKVGARLEMFFDELFDYINNSSEDKKVITEAMNDLSDDPVCTGVVNSFKNIDGLDDEKVTDILTTVAIVAMVRTLILESKDYQESSSQARDENGNPVVVETLKPEMSTHHTNDDKQRNNQCPPVVIAQSYDLVIDQMKQGEKKDIDESFFEATKVLLSDNDYERAGEILKPYYSLLMNNLDKIVGKNYQHLSSRGDYEMMFDMMDGLLPKGDRPIEVDNAVKMSTYALMSKRCCGDMDDDHDGFCRDYVKGAAVLFTLLGPYCGSNVDVAKFFEMVINNRNMFDTISSNMNVDDILSKRTNVNTNLHLTGNGRNYHSMRAGRSEFWLNKGVDLLKTA